MSEVWGKYDYNTPPVVGAILTDSGWEIPLKGTDPSKNLTEIIVAMKSAASSLTKAGAANILSITIPVAKWYKETDVLTFIATFNENVDVDTTGGTPSMNITLNTGGTVLASFVSGSGTNKLTFAYTIQAGEEDKDGVVLVNDIQLNSGTIKDSTSATNSDLTFVSPDVSGILVDTIAPTISSATAPAGDVDTAGTIDVTILFDEVVNVDTTGGTPTITLFDNDGTTPVDGVTAAFVSGSGTASLLFKYTVEAGDAEAIAVKAGANVTLNGGTIKDLAGNSATLTFTQATLTGVTMNQP